MAPAPLATAGGMADTGKGDDVGNLAVAEAATEVLEVGERTLSELAATINREHALTVQASSAMVEHAIRAGMALLEANAQCPKRTWHKWLGENFDATIYTASVYMRLALYQDRIRSEGHTAITAAIKSLVGAPARDGITQMYPAWMKREANRLTAEGVSRRAIGVKLGVSYQTVQNWTDPQGAAERNRRNLVTARATRSARLQAQREAAIKCAVRKAGAATAEAWAMAERMQDVLAQAHRETEDREARRALSEAGVHYRKMRDEIVRALGVS